MQIHTQIAAALNWPLKDVITVPLAGLRDLVRPVNPELADDISIIIETGEHLFETNLGEPCEICQKDFTHTACSSCGRFVCDTCYPNLMEPCKLCHPEPVVGTLWVSNDPRAVSHIWELHDITHDGKGGPVKYWLHLHKRDENAPFDGMGVGFRASVERGFFEKRAVPYKEP